MAEAKIHRDSPGDKVLYDAEHPEPLPFQKWKALPTERTITRNFEVFDPLDFLAQVTQHIPDKNQHLTRYYGWYSNVSRGKRAKGKGKQYKETYVRPASEAHKCWAILLKQVRQASVVERLKVGGILNVLWLTHRD
ncbi:MAG: transposase, partial [bacterium]